jgi:hypothetical protein
MNVRLEQFQRTADGNPSIGEQYAARAARFPSSLRRCSSNWATRIMKNICAALLACLALLVSAARHADPLKMIAVLNFELLDDQHELSPAKAEYARLPAISDQLREAFTKNGLYRVVDNKLEMALVERYHTSQPLYACNGCELEIGKALHADRVLVGWVQKVSNLILNINIAIKDVATGEVVLNKSVDLRGNTDETWRRGIDYLVKSMVDKHQGNR